MSRKGNVISFDYGELNRLFTPQVTSDRIRSNWPHRNVDYALKFKINSISILNSNMAARTLDNTGLARKLDNILHYFINIELQYI